MTSKSYKIRYLPIFERDLTDITEYIVYHLKNKIAALTFVEKVERAILERAKNPLSFEKYSSKCEREYAYYRIYVDNFVIYYVVIEDTMEIRRIIYGKRDFDKLF